MVSFSNAGRFGNWFMQAATAIAYSLRHGLDFSMPIQKNDPFWNPIYATHLRNPRYNHSIEEIHLWENGHEYQELPFNEEWRDKNIIVEGYRQSEKYFKDFRTEILYLLGFPYEMKKGYVSVHVRRGDYLTLKEKHPYIGKEWYEQAMVLFDGYKFKFFSDEIAWCIQEFGGREDCEFSSNSDIEADFIEMQNCEHNICSASTFAWASMWCNRNENKRVIFPQKWFTDGWCELNTKDIVPEWCEKL
jgi:hypothetical protein